MTKRVTHRLEGLEPDNFLAFMALLGLLRALETARPQWRPRIFWEIEHQPWRPVLTLASDASQDEIADAAAEGVASLASAHDFKGRNSIDFSREEAAQLLSDENKDRRALFACLVSTAAYKDDGAPLPTPYCLMFGQGHQHFLDRFAKVPSEPSPPPRGRGKKAEGVSPAEAIRESIFAPWNRIDPTDSFRWDPEEANRYALRAKNPSSDAEAKTTQHGANRLAAIALPLLPTAAVARRGAVKLLAVGARYSEDGSICISWPIWRSLTGLAGVLALMRAGLGSASLRPPDVVAFMRAERASLGKFMIMTPALTEPISG